MSKKPLIPLITVPSKSPILSKSQFFVFFIPFQIPSSKFLPMLNPSENLVFMAFKALVATERANYLKN